MNREPISIAPVDYEQAVCKMLQAPGLPELQFQPVPELQRDQGLDGYTFGLTACSYDGLPRYLIQCEHTGQTVSTDEIHQLRHRVTQYDADRGLIVTTAGFDADAIATAERYGITPILLAEEASAWDNCESSNQGYVGWHCHAGHMSLLCDEYPDHVALSLGARVRYLPDRETAVLAFNGLYQLHRYT